MSNSSDSSFLSGRKPGIYNNKIFRVVLKIVSEVSGALYPMAVRLLSTSRTIAVVYPFYGIKERIIIAAVYVYLLNLGLRQRMSFVPGFEIGYGADERFCLETEKQGNLPIRKAL